MMFPIVACLLIAASAMFYRPGAVAFGADEAALIGRAINANAAGQIASAGLTGTMGLPYGPLPTQVYQLLMLILPDPIAVVSLRAAAFLLITGVALTSLARSIGVSRWLGPIVCSLPWVWMHARQPWDNSLLIPASAVMLGSYAAWLGGRRWAVVPGIVAGGAMLSIHLMSLPMIAAVGIHAIVRMRKQLWRDTWLILVGTAIVAIMNWNYPAALAEAMRMNQQTQSYAALAKPVETGRSTQVLQTLTWPISGVLLRESFSIPPLVWAGPIVLVLAWVRARGDVHIARTQMLVVATIAVLLAGLMMAVLRTPLFPHYQHATLIATAIVCGMALRTAGLALQTAGLALRTASLACLSRVALACWFVLCVVSVQRNVERLRLAQPVLEDLIALQHELNARRASAVNTYVLLFYTQPNVLWTMSRWMPGDEGGRERIVNVRFEPGSQARWALADDATRADNTIDLAGDVERPVYGAWLLP